MDEFHEWLATRQPAGLLEIRRCFGVRDTGAGSNLQQRLNLTGYSLSDRMPGELVLNALRNAGPQETPSRGTLFHSDRGDQCASDDVRRALDALGTMVRMSRKGDGGDHAVTESLFTTLKAEDATEPYATKREAHRAIAEYIPVFTIPSVCTHHSDIGRPTSMRRDCNTSIKTHLRGPSRRDHFNGWWSFSNGSATSPGSKAQNRIRAACHHQIVHKAPRLWEYMKYIYHAIICIERISVGTRS